MAAPVGPYSPHYRIGNLIAISGQLGLVDGVLADRSEERRVGVLANLADQLEQAGLSKSDVIKTMVFLPDLDNFAVLNEKYAAFFDGHRPARSTIGVAALPMGADVEIEAWAYLAE